MINALAAAKIKRCFKIELLRLFFCNNRFLLHQLGKTLTEQRNHDVKTSPNTVAKLSNPKHYTKYHHCSLNYIQFIDQYRGKDLWETLSLDYQTADKFEQQEAAKEAS